MPATITVQLNMKDLVGRIDRLVANAPYAIARALNRSIASAKTVMVREIASDMDLAAGDVRDRIGVVEASAPDRLRATLTAIPTRIPLIAFHARGPEPSRGRGRGVTARLPGGAGTYAHAFIASMASGHRGVFQRVGTRRLPIRELQGPSVLHVFVKHVAVGLARGEEQLVKNLQSELRFAIRSAAA